MRFKPKPRYSAGAFVDLDEPILEASLVGEMLPQPFVVDSAHNVSKLDDVLGNGFSLLGPLHALEQVESKLCEPIWQQLNPTCVALSWSSAQLANVQSPDWIRSVRVANGNEAGADPQNSTYARPIRTHRDQVMLIRPDRYVAGAFFAADFDAFTAKLRGAMFLVA
jgi:3-(3-hydroxy-phenyl)propionate hydroxylase